jgi:GNAT superfamily N-acetyltransferase
MTLSTVDFGWQPHGQRTLPPLYVLEIRPRLDPEAAPIAWLLVERIERTRFYDPPHDNRLAEASLTLNYRLLLPRSARQQRAAGDFNGAYSAHSDRLSLTSPTGGFGAVFLTLPRLEGNRIGTYMMNQIVQWGRRWPTAEVAEIKLLAGQATSDNKDRRNRLYTQFGIEFEYTDDSHAEGHSKFMQARDLTPVHSWADNISEHSLEDYISDLLERAQKAEDDVDRLQRRVDSQKQRLDALQATPIRWALSLTWARLTPTLQLVGFIAVFVLLAVYSYNG